MKDNIEADNSIEHFMTLFNKMFSETKYNLQALNKRMESLDKCFNNIMLLNSDKPFEEEEEQKIDKYKSQYMPCEESSKNLKITSKELDEIERMFYEIEKPKNENSNSYIGQKRNSDIYNKNEIKKNKKPNDKKYNLLYDEEDYWD